MMCEKAGVGNDEENHVIDGLFLLHVFYRRHGFRH